MFTFQKLVSHLFLIALIPLCADCYAQSQNRTATQNPDRKTDAKRFFELLEQVKKEKKSGPIFADKDLYHIYSRRPDVRLKINPATRAMLNTAKYERLQKIRALEAPKHRPSVLNSPASLVGPLSLGPAYGTLMFQNSLNQMPYWDGLALPWNGTIGSRYFLSSGPLTIPYELALQNRLQMTTVTDAYGNQLITLTDNGTGYFRQYEIINRLDSHPPRGTANPLYTKGYYVSTYTGQFPGTNTSSFPGVFVPYQPFETTFGYQGDLDTFGPFGRGQTPLNPPGPPPIPTYQPPTTFP